MPVSGIIELLDDDSVRFLVSSDLNFSGIVMLQFYNCSLSFTDTLHFQLLDCSLQ